MSGPKPPARLLNHWYRRWAGFVLGGATIFALHAVTGAVTAADPGVPTAPASRSAADVMRELNEAGRAMAEVLPSMQTLYDQQTRQPVADKALPAMRRLNGLLQELATVQPAAAEQAQRASLELLTWMTVLGDAEAEDNLRQVTVSPDATRSSEAKASLVLARWVRAKGDAVQQEKLARELSGLARSHPQTLMVAQIAIVMAETATTPALAEQVEQVVTQDMSHPGAKQIADRLAALRKLRLQIGRPLTIEGTTVQGAAFSSASLKGKVVLVDFWATWCGPCREAMPELKAFYAAHKADGLEVVGVSSDRDADDLKGYLAENRDITWPQLFDPSHPDKHPLLDQLGVLSLPTMFAIDRNGIVRSVSAQDSYKQLVPQLLAEKVGPAGAETAPK